MNLFCCEEVCNEGTDQTTFYPRRSSYKFNNYSSQSTDSQSSPRKFILLNNAGSHIPPQQILTLVRPVTMSPSKATIIRPTYCTPMSKLETQFQKSISMTQPRGLKPETPINGLMDIIVQEKQSHYRQTFQPHQGKTNNYFPHH